MVARAVADVPDDLSDRVLLRGAAGHRPRHWLRGPFDCSASDLANMGRLDGYRPVFEVPDAFVEQMATTVDLI